MLTTIGGLGSCSGLALEVGRSTLTPAVIIGAATMKTISSTSITSTSGVTLMSLTGDGRVAGPEDRRTPMSGSLRRQRRHVVARVVCAGRRHVDILHLRLPCFQLA